MVGIDKVNYGFWNFYTYKNEAFAENTNCSNNAVTLLNASRSWKIQSVMCMAPEFLHDKGNHVSFTKLLFQRMFIHCTMVFSFT